MTASESDVPAEPDAPSEYDAPKVQAGPARQTTAYLKKLFAQVGFTIDARRGQNFLVDLNLLDVLERAAGITPADVVLEVGTGTGALTERLACAAGRVVTCEIDPRLAQLARERLMQIDDVRGGDIDGRFLRGGIRLGKGGDVAAFEGHAHDAVGASDGLGQGGHLDLGAFLHGHDIVDDVLGDGRGGSAPRVAVFNKDANRELGHIVGGEGDEPGIGGLLRVGGLGGAGLAGQGREF